MPSFTIVIRGIVVKTRQLRLIKTIYSPRRTVVYLQQLTKLVSVLHQSPDNRHCCLPIVDNYAYEFSSFVPSSSSPLLPHRSRISLLSKHRYPRSRADNNPSRLPSPPRYPRETIERFPIPSSKRIVAARTNAGRTALGYGWRLTVSFNSSKNHPLQQETQLPPGQTADLALSCPLPTQESVEGAAGRDCQLSVCK